MSLPFPSVKKKLGFGAMRLPVKDGNIDYAETCKMVDAFLEQGFNYFDTAHIYHGGQSELALRECLVKRHPRESYFYADKLSGSCFQKEEEIRPLFEKQLEDSGLTYFDFYLLHAQTATLFERYKKCHAYEIALQLKEEGKIRHVGLSFHDTAQVLDQILTEYPQMEFVQLQFNYLDYEDSAVQSRQCYEVCQKHKKPVIVMEPVKGGHLVNLPTQAQDLLRSLQGGSIASYAIRFCAGFENVFMVLSGMSNMEQLLDNVSYMKDFVPLSPKELEAVSQVTEIIRAQTLISCTACRYCIEGCPKHISIPDLFTCYNERIRYHDWNSGNYYAIHTQNGNRASDCIGCGKCEAICPQHLPIRALLANVAKEFDSVKK